MFSMYMFFFCKCVNIFGINVLVYELIGGMGTFINESMLIKSLILKLN